jgi:site-specific recombinase
LRTNVQLLARKIIEHAGETGEHYITATRREYWKMVASAAGGGVLTVGTVFFKYLVTWHHLPLFVEGFLCSTNYAVSFVLLQLFGFTLATKQPSMTAAALAGALRASHSPETETETETAMAMATATTIVTTKEAATAQETATEAAARAPALDELVTLIARICRSQLAAAAGNICSVVPAAIAFHVWYLRSHGHAFFDAAAAEHTFESLHPIHSGTIGFAALTGVLLWLSSLGAGWLENWATYRRIPDGIAQHRLGRIVGARTMRFIARKLRHHLAGFGGNVSLGFLLGMTPVVGKFFGLALEVRHVTLQTGGLTMAACAFGPGVLARADFWVAASGIVVVGLFNFGVSFALALGVAMRARGIPHGGTRLLRAVGARLFASPREFFLPPR